MKVSAIIPAFNEGPRVTEVARTLMRSALLDEVLVVDDGSEDDTALRAMETGARVVKLAGNVGKGGAVARGLSETDGEVVLLIDADLIGLTGKHVEDLLKPVMDGRADMTIGLFRGGRTSTHFSNAIAKHFTGQRAFRRSLIDPGELLNTRYGLEAILTQISREKSLRVQKVCLDDLSQVTKEEKMGFSRGSRLRMTMYSEVVRQFIRRAILPR